jgi:glycosyltransferase involved in cell wall biosynthesis
MKVSLITVSYNAAASIEDTLRSVDAQTHPDIEHLIIDGDSSDGTQGVVERYEAPWRRMISEPDEGLYDAMNKGIRMATGKLIGVLNADDLLEDEKVIADVVEAFSTRDPDAVYGDLVYVDPDDTGRVTRRWKAGPYRKGLFKKGWMPPHPTFYVRSSFYHAYGGYRTELSSSADYELMLRFVHKHGAQLHYLDRTMVRMRVGGKSNVSLWNRLRANKEDRRAWRMNGLKPAFYTLWLKPLSKLSQFFRSG